MDERLQKTIASLDSTTALTLRQEIMWAALKALIATHPDRGAARREFDRALAQFQTSGSMLAAPEGVRGLVRDLVKSLFQEAQ